MLIYIAAHYLRCYFFIFMTTIPKDETTLSIFRTVRLDFVERDGNRVSVRAAPGKSILDIAIANDIELEGALHTSDFSFPLSFATVPSF